MRHQFRLHANWQTQLSSWHSSQVWHRYFPFSRGWSCVTFCMHGTLALSDKLEVFSCLGWSFLIWKQFFGKSEKAKLTSFHVAAHIMQGNAVVPPWSHLSKLPSELSLMRQSHKYQKTQTEIFTIACFFVRGRIGKGLYLDIYIRTGRFFSHSN